MKAKRSTLDMKHFVKKTEKPVTDHDDLSHESKVDMCFRIPGLPHSVVMHAQSTSVRKLIQKIEHNQDRRSSTRPTTKSSI